MLGRLRGMVRGRWPSKAALLSALKTCRAQVVAMPLGGMKDLEIAFPAIETGRMAEIPRRGEEFNLIQFSGGLQHRGMHACQHLPD